MKCTRILAAATIGVLLAACSDSIESPTTPAPEVTPNLVEPSASPPPAASPTVDVPSGTATGIPSVDAAIASVLTGDEVAFRDLIELRDVPCTNEFGIGGPPKCWYAPGGAAPDGTVLSVFPLSVCELEWHSDETLDGFLRDAFFSREYELYGVVRFDFETPLFGEPDLPTPEYGVILKYDRPEITDRGALVMLRRDRVVYLSILCDGAPDDYLSHPQFVPADLILLGPAFP